MTEAVTISQPNNIYDSINQDNCDNFDYWDDYDERDIIENMNYSSLTTQAKNIIDSITDEIVFKYEEYNWDGKVDMYGPFNHFWTLFVFVKKQDEMGTIEHLKFYREVYEKHGDIDEHIQYTPEQMYNSDYNKFEKFI